MRNLNHIRRRAKYSRESWGSLNAKHLKAYRPAWNWLGLRGSDACLKWSFRDLRNLDVALGFFPRRRTAIQAGGNLGLFPKRLAEEFARVYSFEPDAKLHACCVNNAPEKNIHHIQAALGSDRSPVAMHGGRRDNSGRASHEGLTHVVGAGKIPQILIDDLKLGDVDLIYLDIEGYEHRALVGAVDTIARCRPMIVVEINGTGRHYGVTSEETRQWITQRGYVRVFRQNSDEGYMPV